MESWECSDGYEQFSTSEEQEWDSGNESSRHALELNHVNKEECHVSDIINCMSFAEPAYISYSTVPVLL